MPEYERLQAIFVGSPDLLVLPFQLNGIKSKFCKTKEERKSFFLSPISVGTGKLQTFSSKLREAEKLASLHVQTTTHKGGWPQRPVCHTGAAGPSKILQEKARKQNATCNDVLPNMERKQVSVDTVRGRILSWPPGPAPVRVYITRPFLCGRTCGLMGHQPAMTLLEPCLC